MLHDSDGWLAVIEIDAPIWLPVPDPEALAGRITTDAEYLGLDATDDAPIGQAPPDPGPGAFRAYGRPCVAQRSLSPYDDTDRPDDPLDGSAPLRARVRIVSLVSPRRRRMFVAVRIPPAVAISAGIAPSDALRAAVAYAARTLRVAHRILDAEQLATALDTARGGPGDIDESWDHLRIGSTWQTTVHSDAAPADLIARLADGAGRAAFAVGHGPGTIAVRCLAPTPAALVTAVALVRDAVGGRMTGSGGAQPTALRRTLPLATAP